MPDASIFSHQLPGIRWVEVRVRDTMQSIALRELDTASRMPTTSLGPPIYCCHSLA